MPIISIDAERDAELLKQEVSARGARGVLLCLDAPQYLIGLSLFCARQQMVIADVLDHEEFDYEFDGKPIRVDNTRHNKVMLLFKSLAEVSNKQTNPTAPQP